MEIFDTKKLRNWLRTDALIIVTLNYSQKLI